ncbi:hypothetical protein CEXT_406861 [Caerostris extrusa]|uniref:Uncharacterized protein n=1 Tax=Caerostris extrusa TaxID=172846 RepID=A0AAV4XXS1_CAEEX|nr:hypothetical protein CEXT_406861 [Caerostris extrusa]
MQYGSAYLDRKSFLRRRPRNIKFPNHHTPPSFQKPLKCESKSSSSGLCLRICIGAGRTAASFTCSTRPYKGRSSCCDVEKSKKSRQSYLKINIRVLTAESNGNFLRLVSSPDHHTLSLIDSPNFKKGKTAAAVRFCVLRAACHRARIQPRSFHFAFLSARPESRSKRSNHAWNNGDSTTTNLYQTVDVSLRMRDKMPFLDSTDQKNV